MKKSLETKRRLIDTTKNLLKTASDITIKDICDAAIVNTAAVNYHFGDKETLISVAVNEILHDLKQCIYSRISDDFPSTEQALSTFIDLLYNFSVENVGVMGYLFSFSNTSADNKFLDAFLLDKEFTGIVFEKFGEIPNTSTNPAANIAKLMALFSTFLMPMFCQYGIVRYGLEKELGQYSTSNSQFKKAYVAQLMNILAS
jgi:AcrR family transcriptional regulator